MAINYRSHFAYRIDALCLMAAIAALAFVACAAL
jgi:hypothetical protein